MEGTSPASYKAVRIRCPQCFNYMYATTDGIHSVKGVCPHCKSRVFEQRLSKERVIHIKGNN